jgi:molecular chaperone GrpE
LSGRQQADGWQGWDLILDFGFWIWIGLDPPSQIADRQSQIQNPKSELGTPLSSVLLRPGWLCMFRVPERVDDMNLDPEQENQTSVSDQPPAQSGFVPDGDSVAEPCEARNAESIEELKARAAKAEEHWDRLLRARADLENYRKRATRDRQEAVLSAQVALWEKLLPAFDSLDKALAATGRVDGGNLESLKTGLNLAGQQLRTSLAEAGLEEIDATSQVFDPNLHEALSQQESSEVPEGHVLHQIRKGYKLRGRLVRPASVIVAKRPAG